MSKQKVCNMTDLVKNSGVCALVKTGTEEQQVALFYMPETEQKIFAISNWDPVGNANVMSRGLTGSIGDDIMVSSPLYKQHYCLATGKCLDDDELSVKIFDVSIEDDTVYIRT
ncbi:MAG: nitrite reductase small subunit NirD [Arenicella sp.]|nr:nitrite reductase small subunit NirD [Arenicella sp.]